jgi:purine-binding chemotaxis protein CheW
MNKKNKNDIKANVPDKKQADTENNPTHDYGMLSHNIENPEHGDKKYSKKAILKMRADELGKKLEDEADSNDMINIVEFVMGGEKYGIEVKYISEVYHLNNFKKLPCTPEFIAGIINFHGRVLSVVDLKVILRLFSRGITNSSRAIILQSDQMEFGVLADSIIGINSISTTSIQSALLTLSDTQNEYFKGVTIDNIVILNGFKILSDSKLIVNDKA